jgi:hypothetical protein
MGRIMFRHALLPTLLLGTVLLGAQQPEPEGSPGITGLEASVVGDAVHVSFTLEGAFGGELLERIESGLPTGYLYRLQLLRDRKRWWDHRLVETRVEVLAMFNAVTREYLVNTKQNGKLVESRVARNVEELEAALTRVEELPAFHLGGASRDGRLLVKARAELGARTVFAFIPTSVRTGWAESEKFRAAPR